MANIGIEEYRNFIENANSIIIRFDPQGNFTYLNNFAQHFFGFTEKELIGKSLIGTIVPSTDFSGKDLEAMINDLLTNPQKYINNENENITKDGRHVWISWTNKPLLGTSGQLEEILSIGNDISQLKRIEVELKKAEELVESTGRIGTIICEANWQVRSFNSAAKKYFCSGEQEPDCHDLVALFFKDYTPSLPIEKIRDLSIPHLTFDLVRPESATNKALYLQVNREIIRTQRAVVSIILSIQDVTEQRQEELLKQDFLSHISHKLRTPVTVIMESARMLKAGTLGPLSEKQQPLINALEEEALRLFGLISNLLNFVTINSENISPKKESLKLSVCIPELIKPLFSVVKSKQVNFQFTCPDQELTLTFNNTHFNLIISNLIDNAIKFNDKTEIVINCTVAQENGRVIITIADNGPGIPIEEQEKIFTQFYQPEKYFTGNVEGNGLGLSLVKKIVNLNKGKISVQSTIGQGASFTLSFPAG